MYDGESLLVAFKGVYHLNNLDPGPLWFCMALLLFAGLSATWRQWANPQNSSTETLPRFAWLFGAAIILGLLNFSVRLVVPVGNSILW